GELFLGKSSGGLVSGQRAVRELRQLRQEHRRFAGGNISDANRWLAKNAISGNQLELLVELDSDRRAVEGLKVLKGATEETVIGRDGAKVFVDRRRSGRVDFNSKFSGVH